MDRGSYIVYHNRPAVRFQRTYRHPIAELWAAISQPSELAHWFPQTVRMQQRVGGTIEFCDDPNTSPMVGTVLVFDPPRRLAYTWGTDELHFELEPITDGSCRLTLINVLSARDTAARNAAGWSVCLAELDKHIRGERAEGPHSDTAQAWQPHYDAYVADGMPSGAEIPCSQPTRGD